MWKYTILGMCTGSLAYDYMAYSNNPLRLIEIVGLVCVIAYLIKMEV